MTVYWDGVPGATGYRVRWGLQSGSYPNASGVLPASARRYTVSGLVSEQEYYFVVEAEWNGVWGVPSEEDSAVPHVGAIPWDTQDPNQIIPAIRSLTEPPYGYLVALSPEGLLYTEDVYGYRTVRPAPYSYNPDESQIEAGQGSIIAPLQRTGDDAESSTGPYRRVSTHEAAGCIGAIVMFYVPPPAFVYSRFINILSDTWTMRTGARDTPYVYLGIRYGRTDIKGGIGFHPAGRGIRVRQDDGREWEQGPNYDRWQPYLKVGERYFPVAFEEITSPNNHIRYDNAPYGLIVRLRLVPDVRRAKGVEFKVKVWAAEFQDPTFDEPLIYDFYGFADVKPPDRSAGARVRRVVSIAQKKQVVRNIGGYQRTGSFFEAVGIGYQPLFGVGELPFTAQVYCPPNYRLWNFGVATNFPTVGGIVSVDERARYYQEVVHINLRR